MESDMDAEFLRYVGHFHGLRKCLHFLYRKPSGGRSDGPCMSRPEWKRRAYYFEIRLCPAKAGRIGVDDYA